MAQVIPLSLYFLYKCKVVGKKCKGLATSKRTEETMHFDKTYLIFELDQTLADFLSVNCYLLEKSLQKNQKTETRLEMKENACMFDSSHMVAILLTQLVQICNHRPYSPRE
jgi:hypothetical protein